MIVRDMFRRLDTCAEKHILLPDGILEPVRLKTLQQSEM